MWVLTKWNFSFAGVGSRLFPKDHGAFGSRGTFKRWVSLWGPRSLGRALEGKSGNLPFFLLLCLASWLPQSERFPPFLPALMICPSAGPNQQSPSVLGSKLCNCQRILLSWFISGMILIYIVKYFVQNFNHLIFTIIIFSMFKSNRKSSMRLRSIGHIF